MTATHVHLILNHVPVLGVLLAGVLLVAASWLRSTAFQRLALVGLVVFALTAIPVYLTGESAEDAAERAGGASETAIERHEDAATGAFVAVEVLGGLALLSLLAIGRGPAVSGIVTTVVLVATLVTSGLFAWTGYLGGQIRHSEAGGIVASATERAKADRKPGKRAGVERAKADHDDD
jgi:hypothetical protein